MDYACSLRMAYLAYGFESVNCLNYPFCLVCADGRQEGEVSTGQAVSWTMGHYYNASIRVLKVLSSLLNS